MRLAKLIELKQIALVLVFTSGVAVLQPLTARAVQSATLSWNPSPSPNVRGYEIYYGTNSGSYDNQVVVSRTTTNTTVWGLVAGKTYFFAARSFKSAQVQSDYSPELSYTVPPDAPNQPPILTKLLAQKTFVAGQNLIFSISALGTGTLKYQWNFNGQSVPAATNAVLTLVHATPELAGTYSVTVSDDIGATNSNTAELTLHVAAASTQIAAALTTVTGLATPNDTGKQYAFDVSGVAGDIYVVQASANLQDWTAVQTNIAPFTFIDTNVDGTAQQFYRAVHQ